MMKKKWIFALIGLMLLHLTTAMTNLTVSGTGNLLIFEVYRDYANDTLTDDARFISLRIKYGRTV